MQLGSWLSSWGPLPSSHPFASIAMTVAAPSANGTRATSRPAPPRPSQRPPSALELIRSTDRAVEAPAPTSAPEAPQAPPSGFSPEQLAALSAPLDRANVRQREQGRSKVHYLEGWPYLDEAVLLRTRSRRVCMTCHWFRHHAGVNCIPVLTCQLHQGLIAHGEHLTSHCQGWTDDQVRQKGWAPEVA